MQSHGAWLGQGVCFGGAEVISEPHALLAIEEGLSLASPEGSDEELYAGVWRREEQLSGRVVRNRWRLLQAALLPYKAAQLPLAGQAGRPLKRENQ